MTEQKRICRLCSEQKNMTEFYKHPAMTGGRDSKCKECAREIMRKARSRRIEYYREYDRKRADDPERVSARKRYSKETARNPEYSARWDSKNKVKKRAHTMVSNAIKYGQLERVGTCECCGSKERVEAHHENYFKPLEVNWLCPPCHGKRHREINEAIRSGENWKHRGF